jgi:hypothetical protein
LFNIVHKLYSGQGSEAQRQSKKGKATSSPRQNKRPTLAEGQPLERTNSFIYRFVIIYIHAGRGSQQSQQSQRSRPLGQAVNFYLPVQFQKPT